MAGGDEDPGRIVDADGVVGRRMEDEQRTMQLPDRLTQRMTADVVEEALGDPEVPPGDRDFGAPFASISGAASASRWRT